MGTLFSQPVRNPRHIHLDYSIRDMLRVAAREGVTIEQATAIYQAEALNRIANLMWNDGDIKDEQLAGLGDILAEIASGINSLVNFVAEMDD